MLGIRTPVVIDINGHKYENIITGRDGSRKRHFIECEPPGIKGYIPDSFDFDKNPVYLREVVLDGSGILMESNCVLAPNEQIDLGQIIWPEIAKAVRGSELARAMNGFRVVDQPTMIGKFAYDGDRETGRIDSRKLLEQRINVLFELCRCSELPNSS